MRTCTMSTVPLPISTTAPREEWRLQGKDLPTAAISGITAASRLVRPEKQGPRLRTLGRPTARGVPRAAPAQMVARLSSPHP